MFRVSRQREVMLSVAVLVLISGCGRQTTQSRAPDYAHARDLLVREHFDQASAEAKRGLASAAPGSKLAWDFRLLSIEISLAKREAKQAATALQTRPPRNLALEQARYELLKAHTALLLNENTSADEHLSAARKIAEDIRDQHLLAEIQLRHAALAVRVGNAAEAREQLQSVLSFANAHHEDAMRLSATGNMGFLLLRSARYDDAIPWFEQALSQARALGAETSQARALGNLGSCYFRLGDLDKAVRNFQEAESRFDSSGIRFEKQIWLGNIGNIEESERDYDRAALHYSQALAISRELASKSWTATWLNNLAAVSIERNDWDAAERYNQEALSRNRESEDETGAAFSLINAGRIAEGRADYASAAKNFQTVLQHPPPELTPVLDAHAGLAEAYAGQGRLRAADAEFRAAIAVVARQQTALLDEQQKLTWFSGLIRLYQDYVDFLMRGRRVAEALEVVESSRGRVLSARLGETAPLPTKPPDPRKLAAKSAGTLLVYWVGPSKSYAWSVTADRIRTYELPPEDQLRALLKSYDTSIQELHDPLRESCRDAEVLFDTLISPAGITGRKVIIAPDGPLYGLNFGTLPVKGGLEPHYWAEDVQISILPSFELQSAAPAQLAPSLLLIGNPVAVTQEYPELASAGSELTSIQQSLPGVKELVYTRAAAHPQSYLHSNPGAFKWIHFAAHAAANREQPLESAVILSPGTDSEYRLFARSVMQTPLRADLVTISSCRSAGAKIYAGEGLVGFSWAFLKSGAHNVIAGLWDVNDRSTAELMAMMYRELVRGCAPAEALRTAQLSLIHSKGVFRKPYYWGAFETFSASN